MISYIHSAWLLVIIKPLIIIIIISQNTFKKDWSRCFLLAGILFRILMSDHYIYNLNYEGKKIHFTNNE